MLGHWWPFGGITGPFLVLSTQSSSSSSGQRGLAEHRLCAGTCAECLRVAQ